MNQRAYTYSVSGAAVTLTGVNVPLSQIALISDPVLGVLYSLTGPAAVSYTQGANSVITLATAPSTGAALTVIYDDGVAASNAPSTVAISGTVPVSASALPLPSGAATDASLTNGNQKTQVTSLPAIPAGGNTIGNVNVLGGNTTAVKTDSSATTQPISAASLPLPTGAAQDGTDGTGITQPTGGAGIRGWLSGIYNILKSSTLAVTQSGTWSLGRTWSLSSGSDSVTATISGTPSVLPSSSTASSTSTFTATTSSQILAANSSRKGVVLASASVNTGICYVTIGTSTTSSSACSFLVNPGDTVSLTGISNALTGIWSASSNTLFVTELT